MRGTQPCPHPQPSALVNQGAELLVVGLAGAQDGNRVDPSHLVQTHHAVEALFQQQGVGLAQVERLGREQDNPPALVALDSLDRDARPSFVGG